MIAFFIKNCYINNRISIIKPAMTGGADYIRILVIIGTLFLLSLQTVLNLLETGNKSNINREVPMKKSVLVIENATKAILSFMFNLGTNILASFCLQT